MVKLCKKISKIYFNEYGEIKIQIRIICWTIKFKTYQELENKLKTISKNNYVFIYSYHPFKIILGTQRKKKYLEPTFKNPYKIEKISFSEFKRKSKISIGYSFIWYKKIKTQPPLKIHIF